MAGVGPRASIRIAPEPGRASTALGLRFEVIFYFNRQLYPFWSGTGTQIDEQTTSLTSLTDAFIAADLGLSEIRL